jgi:hypothetical protein
MPTAEQLRLDETRLNDVPWKKWGPYLSERQWGTVREDYSADGDAWNYFTHDQARARAYRWGEDGLAGYSDDKQRLCFALALWNGVDPILKERCFGLTNSEGNHGEDVKEYYFYLDSTPTHSYMKYLYKYPQRPYPYDDLVQTNRQRSRSELEYELIDTGVFDDDRYFDVFVEYAKEAPEDTLIKITVFNRGPEAADLHVLPHLWFRNTWSWTKGGPKPSLRQISDVAHASALMSAHPELHNYYFYCDSSPALLFTENETNTERIAGTPNASPYVKDSINDYVVHGQADRVNPDRAGTKAAAHYRLHIEAGQSHVIRLRLNQVPLVDLDATYPGGDPFGAHFDEVLAARLQEADQFFDSITPDALDVDQSSVFRQAIAGMLWGKQYYYFDLDRWLEEHGANPLRALARRGVRNVQWYHMVNDDILSMPDKWEYPWYAAWDLAFHTTVLALADFDFAKQQLNLMLQELYLHPSGQIPAYEWNFSDVNPPVHAWATMYVYSYEKELRGRGDVDWLKTSFQKLLLNFTWWVNRKDPSGKNVFEGGFLGLDNIGVFDRSSALPTGGYLEQADGTAWMAFFCQSMLEIALELSLHDPSYEDMALKFFEHFLYIAAAMDRIGEHQDEMWDEADGFFYDLLRLPDGEATRLKVRSMVGLLPLCATTMIPIEFVQRFPKFIERAQKRFEKQSELVVNIQDPREGGYADRRLLSILDANKLRRVLEKLLDENEFLGPHGIRALSRYHADHPFTISVHGEEFKVEYLPAESNTGMFGGNSNWRGPVWMPVNLLIVRSLLQYYLFYGKEFLVECPTGSGQLKNLYEVAEDIAHRLITIFTRDEHGRRPVYGGTAKFQNDPHWRDYVLFYEYFHGDSGAGLGASHQTGWTGVAARLIQWLGYMTADSALEGGGRPGLTVYRED